MLSEIKVETLGPPGLSPLSIPILNADNNELQITNIEGLGPVTADLSSSALVIREGEFLTNSHVGKRNIVISVRLNPKWVDKTAADLRQSLYPYFNPTREVKLTFISTNHPEVEIMGRVESLEPEIFSSETIMQASVLCFDPFFTATTPEEHNGVVIGGYDPTPLLVKGTESVGFKLRVHNTPERSSYTGTFRLWTVDPTNEMELQGIAVDSTYTLHVCTVPGARSIETHDSSTDEYTNSMQLITFDSVWPMLNPGPTNFRFFGNASGPPPPVAYGLGYSLSYFPKYSGL